MSRRFLIVAAIALSMLAGAAAFVIVKSQHGSSPSFKVDVQKKTGSSLSHVGPTLYCDFYNFMHNATVVSFYFSVDVADAAHPKFTELFVVEPDGTKTDFGGDSAALPQWTYQIADGTPTITSPDATTEIVMYGLKPHASGTFWVETGLRSNDYRNLEGKCRQAHFDGAATP